MQYTKKQYQLANKLNAIHSFIPNIIIHFKQFLPQMKFKKEIKKHIDKISAHIQNIYNHKTKHPFKVSALNGIFLGLFVGIPMSSMTAVLMGIATIDDSVHEKPLTFAQIIINYIVTDGNMMSTSILKNMITIFLIMLVVCLLISMIIYLIDGTAHYIGNIKALAHKLRKE